MSDASKTVTKCCSVCVLHLSLPASIRFGYGSCRLVFFFLIITTGCELCYMLPQMSSNKCNGRWSHPRLRRGGRRRGQKRDITSSRRGLECNWESLARFVDGMLLCYVLLSLLSSLWKQKLEKKETWLPTIWTHSFFFFFSVPLYYSFVSIAYMVTPPLPFLTFLARHLNNGPAAAATVTNNRWRGSPFSARRASVYIYTHTAHLSLSLSFSLQRNFKSITFFSS